MKSKIERLDSTWGCAYVAPGSRQQYTGKSFSKPLSKILNFLLIERKHYEELKQGEIFPEKRSYLSHYHDFFEHKLIDTFTRQLIHSANYFSFIQNGRIQSYVFYGIVFILAMFVLTVFNIVS
jgi:hydrogenase-4 component B